MRSTLTALTLGGLLTLAATAPVDSDYIWKRSPIPPAKDIDYGTFVCMEKCSLTRDGGQRKTDEEVEEAYNTCLQLKEPPTKVNHCTSRCTCTDLTIMLQVKVRGVDVTRPVSGQVSHCIADPGGPGCPNVKRMVELLERNVKIEKRAPEAEPQPQPFKRPLSGQEQHCHVDPRGPGCPNLKNSTVILERIAEAEPLSNPDPDPESEAKRYKKCDGTIMGISCGLVSILFSAFPTQGLTARL